MMFFPLPQAVRRKVSTVIALILSPRGVLVSGLVLLLFSWGLCASVLIESRHDAYDHAVENARNVMLLIERDIARNIELYDLSVQSVVDGISDPQVMSLPPSIRNRVLFDRAASGKYLGSIFVMDPQGNIVLDSGAAPPRQGNFAFRDYFAVHRDGKVRGLYISKPYASQLRHGALTIALSRRITRPDGSFGGIVVGTLSIDYFRALLDGIVVGKQGAAVIVEDNGALVCRLPYDPRLVGLDLRKGMLFTKAMTEREGVLTGPALIDGVRRIFVFRHLTDLPLIVNVAPAESDVYAPWKRRATWLTVMMGIFTAIIASGSLLLSRELKRRQVAESKLFRLAHTDALTGLDNRGTFDAALAMEAQRANRSGRPLSILFFDVDLFKRYNDYYGHQAGDEVLRALARSASRCLRRLDDHIARYGGEEFVVTLPDTDARGALDVAESIRRAIFDLNIEHVQSPYGRVTISIGTATRTGNTAIDARMLVKLADEALYQAKSSGRNCVSEAGRCETAA